MKIHMVLAASLMVIFAMLTGCGQSKVEVTLDPAQEEQLAEQQRVMEEMDARQGEAMKQFRDQQLKERGQQPQAEETTTPQ